MKKKIQSKKVYIVLCLLLIIFIVYYLKKLTGLSLMNLNIDSFEDTLKQNKDVSVFIYMILNLIRPIFIIIPVWIFSVVAGVIYGPILGTIYALIGVYISATIAFYLARIIGRDFFVSVFGNLFRKIDNKLEENGFKVLFIMRVTIVFPFDPLSFIAGLSNMDYRSFIGATLLGSVPETIAFNVLGVSLKSILSLKVIIILSVLIIIIFTLMYLKRRII